MDSALTPREIQSRIRAGEALEEVAKAAGVPPEKIEAYALPVIAEREHLAGTALAAPVRRGGETTGAGTLRTVVNERLVTHHIDVDDVDWDAWRVMNRKWIIQASYVMEGETRTAQFLYDQMGRFSVAHNDDGRWLVQEPTPVPPAERPGRPTAIAHEPTIGFGYQNIPEALGIAEPTVEQLILADDLALGEKNGIYDILSEEETGRLELDNLYDMFTAMQEDSVQIYPGFGGVSPVGPGTARPEAPKPEPAQHSAPQDRPLSRRERRRMQAEQNLRAMQSPQPKTIVPPPQPARPEHEPLSLTDALDEPAVDWKHITRDIPAPRPQPTAEPEPVHLVEEMEQINEVSYLPSAAPQEASPSLPQSAPSPELLSAHDEIDPSEPTVPVTQPSAEPDQPELVPMEEEHTTQIPRAGRKKRASVPSWDEIMFGSPRPKK